MNLEPSDKRDSLLSQQRSRDFLYPALVGHLNIHHGDPGALYCPPGGRRGPPPLSSFHTPLLVRQVDLDLSTHTPSGTNEGRNNSDVCWHVFVLFRALVERL